VQHEQANNSEKEKNVSTGHKGRNILHYHATYKKCQTKKHNNSITGKSSVF